MARPKRTAETIALDRVDIARRYLKGEPQAVIAQSMGLTQQQISYDLKAVRRAWLASAVRNFDAMRAEELAKIDHLERTYWLGWERSLEQSESKTVQGATDERGQMGRAGQRVTINTAKSPGDPRMLEGVRWCIDRRIHLFGLDEALKMEVSWRKELENAEVDAGAIFEQLVNNYAAALQSGDDADAGGGAGAGEAAG